MIGNAPRTSVLLTRYSDCLDAHNFREVAVSSGLACDAGRRSASRKTSPRRGATMVLIVALLPCVILLCAFAINIAYIELVRTEVQVSTDAACRAAGKEFAISGDRERATQIALQVAARNKVAGEGFVLAASDIEFGFSSRPDPTARYEFEVGENANSVRITTDSLSKGAAASPIRPLMPVFGKFINVNPVRSAVSTQVDLDVAIVIDRSGSMAYASGENSGNYPTPPATAPPGWGFGDPVPPNARWLDTIAAVQVFLNELNETPQSEQVALSTYDGATKTDVLLTEDYDMIPTALSEYSKAFQSGHTNIGGGILEGLLAVHDQNLHRNHAVPVIIVMTDGNHNKGTDPRYAARVAKNNNVTVYSVTFSDEAGQWLMRSVASYGGGQHYHATDAQQLKDAFRDIASRLPTLITQ
ncbi:von Willebrand factor type A domain protein [Roseimaritima multifibrata]|uniref:von Willebrand factor type A domain protein n=2 Tax=Roseimaritima multifibrata TaxID=1930274 RepID=A0A517MJA6_9BACT|nr:von Willebrand factor type A domain protein [Roseimaritima multifibrata]